MSKRKRPVDDVYFRNWHRGWYGMFFFPASVTIQHGRVECAALGLPWLTVVHSRPEIVVFKPRLMLMEAFILVGPDGRRIGILAWKSSLLRYRLNQAGFTLVDGSRRFALWF